MDLKEISCGRTVPYCLPYKFLLGRGNIFFFFFFSLAGQGGVEVDELDELGCVEVKIKWDVEGVENGARPDKEERLFILGKCPQFPLKLQFFIGTWLCP